MDDRHCCQCGAPRPLTLPPSRSVAIHSVMAMASLKAISPYSGNEVAPQIVCSLNIYRNGGTNERTHICDDCQRVCLTWMRQAIDAALKAV